MDVPSRARRVRTCVGYDHGYGGRDAHAEGGNRPAGAPADVPARATHGRAGVIGVDRTRSDLFLAGTDSFGVQERIHGVSPQTGRVAAVVPGWCGFVGPGV